MNSYQKDFDLRKHCLHSTDVMSLLWVVLDAFGQVRTGNFEVQPQEHKLRQSNLEVCKAQLTISRISQ